MQKFLRLTTAWPLTKGHRCMGQQGGRRVKPKGGASTWACLVFLLCRRRGLHAALAAELSYLCFAFAFYTHTHERITHILPHTHTHTHITYILTHTNTRITNNKISSMDASATTTTRTRAADAQPHPVLSRVFRSATTSPGQ